MDIDKLKKEIEDIKNKLNNIMNNIMDNINIYYNIYNNIIDNYKRKERIMRYYKI